LPQIDLPGINAKATIHIFLVLKRRLQNLLFTKSSIYKLNTQPALNPLRKRSNHTDAFPSVCYLLELSLVDPRVDCSKII
jgi:hypothetical protein